VSAHDEFNRTLRRAAGRGVTFETSTQSESHDGDVGIGRGAGSVPTPVRDDFAGRFNAEVRAMAGFLRGRYPVEAVIETR
jgi:hypothetical protein